MFSYNIVFTKRENTTLYSLHVCGVVGLVVDDDKTKIRV